MKKNVFLLELILAILMFAIASAVCLRVFVNSRLVSEEATNINEAVLVTSNIEEAFSSAGSVKDAQKLLSRVYPSNLQVSDEGGCIVLSDELEAVYRIGEGKNGTTAITVEVYETGKRASASASTGEDAESTKSAGSSEAGRSASEAIDADGGVEAGASASDSGDGASASDSGDGASASSSGTESKKSASSSRKVVYSVVLEVFYAR